jgi:hypothetical protein
MGKISISNHLISEVERANGKIKDKETQAAVKALVAVARNLLGEINQLKGIHGGIISHPDQLD